MHEEDFSPHKYTKVTFAVAGQMDMHVINIFFLKNIVININGKQRRAERANNIRRLNYRVHETTDKYGDLVA